MTDTVYQYRVYCIEEATYVTVWGTEEPTLCPNNHSNRAIDSSQTVIIDSIETTSVQVHDPSMGIYRLMTEVFDIPAGNTGDISTFNISYPMDVSIWQMELYSHSSNIGDNIDIIVSPNKTVGYLTAPGATGATGLSVSATITDNQFVSKGSYLQLFNNPTIEELGRVTSLTHAGTTGGSVIMENGLTGYYPPGTLVQLNLIIVENLFFCKLNQSHVIGNKGFKSKEIPANTNMRIKYTNNSIEAKKFCAYIETYYR